MGLRPIINAITLRAMARTIGEGIMDFPLSSLRDDALYPILRTTPGDWHEHCVVGLDNQGSEGQLMLHWAAYMRLPTVDVGDRVIYSADAEVTEDVKHLFSKVLAGFDKGPKPAETKITRDDQEDTEDETEAPDEVTGYMCVECGAVTEEEPESPLYECGNCGTCFNRENSADGSSHRCPECNKFGAKVAKYGCPECGAAEMEQGVFYRCPECEEVFPEQEDAESCCRE